MRYQHAVNLSHMQRVSDRKNRKWYLRGLDLVTYKKICALVDKGFNAKQIEFELQLFDKSTVLDALYLYENYKASATVVAITICYSLK